MFLFKQKLLCILGVPGGSVVNSPPAMQEIQEMQFQSLGWEYPLEEDMATHSSNLAWRIPWTGVWRATVRGVARARHA